MRFILGGTIVMAGLVALALLWLDGFVEFAAYQLLLVAFAGLAVRRLRTPESNEEDEPNAPLRFVTRLARKPPRTVPPQLTKVERLVVFGKSTAFDAEWRLLPFLRSIAAERLETHHGLDMVANPDLAGQVIGEPGWELLSPNREQPTDRLAPGLSLASIDVAVTAVERI